MGPETLVFFFFFELFVDFWLTTEDLPLPDNRVTLTRGGGIALSYTPTNTVPQDNLYAQLKSMLGDLGMRENVLIPRHLYMKSDIGLAGVAHQAARRASERIPQSRYSMYIAKRTNSTICMSSMRALCRVSGR